MKIVKTTNKILRQIAEEVSFPLSKDIVETIDFMMDQIDSSQIEGSKLRGGIGMAAPQVGVSKRMFYINTPQTETEDNFRVLLINPKIVGVSPTYSALEYGEGCLSVPEDAKNMDGLVHRKYKVIVSGYSYFDKKNVTITKTGYHAIVLQHELDHLDGKLFYDRIDRKKKWDKKEGEILI